MNNFAISSSGIGEALQRSAAALAVAGNTLEESIALAAGMNEMVQNPEVVGTALKTMTMYLRAAKTEAAEAGIETDGMATSVSKLRDQLEKLTGVDIMLDDNTFKSTYQIIKEISEVWGDLSDVSQANVLNLLGGKRNANSIASLLENFATAEEALAAAQNSAGSAAQENEKYLDSITGKLQVLHANFQAMSSTVMNSDVVAFFIDLLSGLTSVITAIQKVNMLLPLIIASVTVIKGLVGASKIQSISQQIGMLVRRGTDASQIFGMMSTQLGTLSQKQLLAVANTVALNSGIQGGAKNAAEGTIAHMLYAEATRQAGDASAIAAGKFSLLQASIPVIGIALTGLTLIMGLITTATNSYNMSVQQSIDKAKQADQAYKASQETFANNTKTLQSIKKRYEELAKGVDENGKNVSLTAAEYEEFQSLLQQIIDISPSIISGYEGQAAILSGPYVDAVNAAIKAQEELLEAQEKVALGSHQEDYFAGQQEVIRQNLSSLRDVISEIPSDIFSLRQKTDYWGAVNPDLWTDVNRLASTGIITPIGGKVRNGSDDATSAGINTLNDILAIYDQMDQVMSGLRQSGKYAEDELEIIESGILALGPYVEKIREAQSAEAEWLLKRVKYSNKDMFSDLADSELLSLQSLIANTLDPFADYQTQVQDARNVSEQFIQVIGSDSVQNLVKMSAGLKDGTVSVEDYNAAVQAAFDGNSEFADIMPGVVQHVMTYLLSLTNVTKTTKEATGETDALTATTQATGKAMSSLSDVVKNASKSFDLLSKAEAEMTENGKLSASTVQSIIDALEEGESITDYLSVQNGAIVLNTQAWRDRSVAIIQSLRDEVAASIPALEAESMGLRRKLRRNPDDEETRKKLQENAQAIEQANEAIAIYDALIAEMASSENSSYDFGATIKGLDEIQKKGKQIYDWITALKKEGAKALNPTDLLAAFPELAGQDLSTIEAQKTALEGLAETYQTKYTGAIDTAIVAVEGLQQAILAENNVDSKESLAGEALAEYERLGEYVTALRGLHGFSLADLFFGSGSDAVSAQDYTSMLKNAESLASILGVIFGEQDSSNGTNTIGTLQELSKLLGEDWDESKFVTFFEDGSFQINTDALTDYIVQTITGSEATDELKTAMLALLSSGAAEKIASDAEKMSDAVSAASDSFDILKTATEEMGKDGSNGISSKTFMSILKELGEDESISDYLYTENGLLKLNTEAWLARSEAIITSQREVVQANVDAAKAENKKLQAEIEANLDAMYSFDPSEDNYAFYEELEQRNKELQAKIDANNQIIADGTVQIDIYDTALQQLADDLAGGDGDTIFKTALGDLKEMREESKGLFDVLQQLSAEDAKPIDYTTLITQFPELRKYQASELDTVEEQIAAINALIATRQAEYDAAIDAQIGILQARKATLDAEKDAAEITDIDTAIAALTNMKGVTLTALFGDPGEVEEAKDTIVDAFGKVASATSLMKEAAQDTPDWLQIVEYAQKMAEVLGEGHAWTEFLTLNYDEAGNVSGITLAQTAIDGYIDSVVNATITEEQFGDQTDAVRAYFKGLLEEEARVEEETLKLSDALSNLKTGISFMDSVKSGEGDVMSMLESAIKFAETMDNVSVADLINGFTFVDGALTGIDWNTDAIDGYVDSMVDAFIAASGLGEVYPELAEKLKAYIRATQEATDATEAMSAALNNAAKRMDLLKDIREDMESGGLTQETISSMIGALDEGESIVDYIYEENGALKVNIDLWERRARAKLESERADADKRVKDLETEIATMEDVVTRYEDLYATRDKLNQWFAGDDETRESLNLPGVGYAGNWDKDAAEAWYYEVDDQIALLEDAYGSYEEVKDKWIRLEDEFTEAKGVRDIYDVLLGEFGEAPDDKVADALDALDEIQDKFKKAYDWAKDISSGKLIDTNDLATALNAANIDYSQWNITSLAGQRQAVEALKQAYQDLYNVQLGSSTSVLQARRDELEAQETLTDAESQELVAIKSVLTLLGSMGTTTLDEIFSFEPDTKKDLNDAVSAIENAKKLMTEAAKENADPFAMIETAKKMAEALGEGNAWYDFFNFSYDENGMLTGLTLIDEKVTEYTKSVIAAIVADEELEASFPGITAWLTQYAEDASAATQETKSLSDALGDVSKGISFLKQAKAGEDAFGTFQSAISFIESLDNVNVTDIISGFSGSGADFAINWNTTAIEEYIFSLIDASEAVSQVEAVYPGFTAALKESISASTEAEEATIELSDAMSLLSSAGSFLSNARSGEKGGFEMINSAIQLADELNKAIPGATYTWSSFVDSIDASGVTWNLSSIQTAISSLATALVNSGVILEENKEAFIAWATGVATAEEITVEDAMNSVQSASELIQTIGKEIAEDGSNSYGTLLKVMALLDDEFSEEMVLVDEATGKFTINSAAIRQWAKDILDSTDASDKMKKIAEDILALDYKAPEPTDAEKMETAIGQLEKYANILTTVEKEMAEDGGLSAGTLQTLITMFGDKEGFSDAFFTDLNGNLQVNTEILRGWAQEVISAEGMPEAWVSWAQGILDSAGYIDESTTKISDAISSLSAAQSLMKEMSSDTPDILSAISSAQSMADTLNKIQTDKTYSWADYLTPVLKDGVVSGFEMSKDAVYAYADAMIDAAAQTDANVQQNITVIKQLAHEYIDLGMQAKDASDDISHLNDVISFMSSIKSGSNDVLGMMSAALKLSADMGKSFTDLFLGFETDTYGNILGINWDTSVINAYRDSLVQTMITSMGLTDEDGELAKSLRFLIDEASDAEEQMYSFADALSGLSGVHDILQDIVSGEETDQFTMIQQAMELATQMSSIPGQAQKTWKDFLTFTSGQGYAWDVDALKSYHDALMEAAGGVENLTEEEQQWLNYISTVIEATEDASTKLGDLNKAVSFLTDVKAGNNDILSMLSSGLEMADQMGVSLRDILSGFTIDANGAIAGINWDTSLIDMYTDALIQSMLAEAGLEDETGELAAKLREYVDAASEAAKETKTFNDALSSLSSFPSLMQDIIGGDMSQFEMIQKATELATQMAEMTGDTNASWRDFLKFTPGQGFDWDLQRIEAYRARVLDTAEATGDLSDEEREWLEFLTLVSDAAEDAAGRLDELNGVVSFMTNIKAGNNDVIAMFSSGLKMAEQMGVTFQDIFAEFTFDENGGINGINWDTSLVDMYTDALISNMLAAAGVEDETGELAKKLREYVDAASEAAKETKTFTDAISILSDFNGLMQNISGGEMNQFEMIQQAAEMAAKMAEMTGDTGASWRDFLTFTDGEGYGWNADRLEAYRNRVIEAAGGVANLSDAEKEWLSYLSSHIDVVDDTADKLTGLNNVIKFMTDVKSGSNDVLGMMSAALSLATEMDVAFEDLFSGFEIDANGNIVGMNWDVSVVDAYRDSLVQTMLASMGLSDETGELAKVLRGYIDAASDAAQETIEFSDLISDLSSYNDLMQDIFDDSMGQFDMIQRASELAARMTEITGDTNASWRDFLTFTEGEGYAWNAERIEQYRTRVIEAAGGVEHLSDAEKEWLDFLAQNIDAVDDANKKLEDTIKATQSAGKTLLDVQSEIESDGYNSLDTILSVMSLLGDEFDATTDIIDMGNGHFRLSEQAIMSWAEATIEASNAPQHLKDAMLQYLRVGYQYESQVERMEGHFKNATDLISGRGDITRDMELTYDQFSDLISISSEYMNAVDYGNGVLTLNKEKYDEITTSVIEQTRADAAAAAATRLYSQEYQTLMQQYKDGTIDEAGKQRLSTLQAEIMSYSVLVTELDNASSAYKRFLNASTNTSSGRYEAAGNALQVIQDTLYNAGSNVYGKRGREQYQSAVQFLISPDVEVDSDAWKDAMKTVERYVTDGQDGVTNFYNDLVQAGIVVDGQMDTTIDEVASKLGISEELTRTMFDELNQYLETPLTFKNADTSGIEGIGDSAEAAKTPLETLMEKLDQVESSVTALNDGEIAISANPAISSVNTLNQSLDRTANTIDKINRKRINIEAKTTAQSGGLFGGIGNIVSNIFGASEAGGSYAAKGGKTLVGELGPEVVVDPKEGKWRVVGQQGAEFINMPKNAIVFNAEQTRRLFSDGSIKGIGTAMAGGNTEDMLDNAIFIYPASDLSNRPIVHSIDEGLDYFATVFSSSYGSSMGRILANATPILPNGEYLWGDVADSIVWSVVDAIEARVNSGEPIPSYDDEDFWSNFNYEAENGYLFNARDLMLQIADAASVSSETMEELAWKTHELHEQGLADLEAEGALSTRIVEDTGESFGAMWSDVHDTVFGPNFGMTNVGETLMQMIDMDSIQSKIKGIVDYINQAKATLHVDIGGKQKKSSGGIINQALKWLGISAAGGTSSSVGGETLVGELGPELIVDPQNGTYSVAGKHGAEFVNLPKGAIVYNAEQTKDLLRHRGLKQNGYAMASGTGDFWSNLFTSAGATVGNVTATLTTSVLQNVADALSGAVSGVKGTGVSSSNVVLNLPKQQTYTGPAVQSLDDLKNAAEEADKQLEHLIRHQEHLYKVAEIGLDYPGMDAALTEIIRLYRLKMENAEKAVQDMLAAGADDTDENVQAMEEIYWAAYDNLYQKLEELNKLYTDALNAKIDDLQTAYSNLGDAMDEFNSTGGISVDTFQKLLDHGAEYLTFLQDEDGQLSITEDKLQALIAAEKERLAVEQAMAYIERVMQALADDDANLIAKLADVTQQIGDNTWDLVFAQLAALENSELTADQYAAVYHNVEMIRELAGLVNDETRDSAESMVEVIDDLIDRTKELIKFEVDQQIQAIKDQIDEYKELINLKKEALKTAKEEEKYEKGVADRVKEIATMQAKIDQLALDDSREAAAQRAKLLEQLADKQESLSEYQADHAYDAQIDALDKMADTYEESRQPEIDALERSISSEEKLYQAALKRIETGWDTLFSELIAWNTEEGRSLNSEIVETWEAAAAAVAKYGSYREALAHYKEIKGTHLETVEIPKFHGGGIVPNSSGSDDEVLAMLQKGEMVLDDSAKKGLYSLVDFPKYVAERFGVAVDAIRDFVAAVPNMIAPIATAPALALAGAGGGMVINNEFTVSINHNGSMTDGDARRYGRQIADAALGNLYDAFERRGITRASGKSLS